MSVRASTILVATLAVVGCGSPPTPNASGDRRDIRTVDLWPEIKTAEAHAIIENTDEPFAGFDLPIWDDEGNIPYVLSCHGSNYRLGEFSGAVQCKLLQTHRTDPYPNILVSSGSRREWDNRGRFLSESLKAENSSHAEWGKRRVFDVRGMHIIIDVDRITERASGLSVDVSVEPVTSAKNALDNADLAQAPAWAN